MKNLLKAAVLAFGGLGALAIPAGAQPYDPRDDGPYSQPYPNQPYAGQQYPNQQYPNQPYGGQPYGGQPYANQPYGAQQPGPYDQPYEDQGPGPYDQPYDTQSYDDPMYNYYGSDYGYCDPYYGCPDDIYDLPLYYGQVYWGDSWYPGPFYYRDFGGRRQFWVHGGWHDGNFRGGRFGPALGRGFYQSHNFVGRGFNRGGANRYFGGGGNWSRGAYGTNVYRGSGNWNRGGFGGNANRQSFQSQQSFGNGGGFRGRFQGGAMQSAPQQRFGSNWNNGGWRGGVQNQAQQAAPQRFNGGGGFRGNVQAGGGGGFHGQAQHSDGGGWHGGGGGHHH